MAVGNEAVGRSGGPAVQASAKRGIRRFGDRLLSAADRVRRLELVAVSCTEAVRLREEWVAGDPMGNGTSNKPKRGARRDVEEGRAVVTEACVICGVRRGAR